jgi:hypothetical protein
VCRLVPSKMETAGGMRQRPSCVYIRGFDGCQVSPTAKQFFSFKHGISLVWGLSTRSVTATSDLPPHQTA